MGERTPPSILCVSRKGLTGVVNPYIVFNVSGFFATDSALEKLVAFPRVASVLLCKVGDLLSTIVCKLAISCIDYDADMIPTDVVGVAKVDATVVDVDLQDCNCYSVIVYWFHRFLLKN